MSGAGRGRALWSGLALLVAAGLALGLTRILTGADPALPAEPPSGDDVAATDCTSCTARHQAMQRAHDRRLALPAAEEQQDPAAAPP